jgi:hypothetical protein
MRISELFEAKFRKPIPMFHGTSTVFLRSILKTGMVPNPKLKKWDTDPKASLTTQSRVSLSGSYWSGRLMTSISSANNTIEKFGGNKLIIIANIQTQSAKADEDQITFDIPREYDYAFGGVYSTRPDLVAQVYYNSKKYYEDAKSKFVKSLHNSLTENPNKPIPTDLLEELFNTFTIRIISYGIKEAGNDTYYNPIKNINPIPNVPSTEEAESELLKLKDKITRYYRETTEDKGRFSHTLRITDPVDYSGANRITHIIEIPKSYINKNKDFVQPEMILHYGNPKTIPNKFIDEYINRVGDFSGMVVDTSGNIVNIRMTREKE